jgi:hypothetical protein
MRFWKLGTIAFIAFSSLASADETRPQHVGLRHAPFVLAAGGGCVVECRDEASRCSDACFTGRELERARFDLSLERGRELKQCANECTHTYLRCKNSCRF